METHAGTVVNAFHHTVVVRELLLMKGFLLFEDVLSFEVSSRGGSFHL